MRRLLFIAVIGVVLLTMQVYAFEFTGRYIGHDFGLTRNKDMLTVNNRFLINDSDTVTLSTKISRLEQQDLNNKKNDEELTFIYAGSGVYAGEKLIEDSIYTFRLKPICYNKLISKVSKEFSDVYYLINCEVSEIGTVKEDRDSNYTTFNHMYPLIVCEGKLYEITYMSPKKVVDHNRQTWTIFTIKKELYEEIHDSAGSGAGGSGL